MNRRNFLRAAVALALAPRVAPAATSFEPAFIDVTIGDVTDRLELYFDAESYSLALARLDAYKYALVYGAAVYPYYTLGIATPRTHTPRRLLRSPLDKGLTVWHTGCVSPANH